MNEETAKLGGTIRIRRILHFHFGKDGGAERFFVNLAQSFAGRGIEQSFVIRPRRIWKPELAPYGRIFEHKYRRVSLASKLLEWRMARYVDDWKPDVVMGWMPRGARLIGPWPRPFKLVRLGDFPIHIQHFQNCDVVLGNVPGIARRVEDLGWTGRTATITNFAREVTPVPVDRARFDTPKDALLIAGAGRFVPRKGMDLLVRAMAEIPDAWLWLIGDGTERASLEAQVESLGMANRTRFIGWVEEPVHYIAAANLFGMPSRHEPLGNSVLDAWRAGVPVVSTRSEGPDWYMEHEKDGLLVNTDDLGAFRAGLQRLAADPVLAERLRAGGAAKLEGMFSPERIIDQYLSLFAVGLDRAAP
jgi:glycosyltransferase involved in cell wall biosynthesis